MKCKVCEAPSNRTFCSIQCCNEQKYRDNLAKWLAGEISGLSGKKNISTTVKRYIRAKYNDSCCECGENRKHPLTGRSTCEIDHIDGNYLNNVESNLRFLCPTCHSLTLTYKNFNKGRSTRVY